MSFKGGVHNEQSGESPIQAQEDDGSSGDPDSLRVTGGKGSVALVNEKWLVSLGEKSSPGCRRGRA